MYLATLRRMLGRLMMMTTARQKRTWSMYITVNIHTNNLGHTNLILCCASSTDPPLGNIENIKKVRTHINTQVRVYDVLSRRSHKTVPNTTMQPVQWSGGRLLSSGVVSVNHHFWCDGKMDEDKLGLCVSSTCGVKKVLSDRISLNWILTLRNLT